MGVFPHYDKGKDSGLPVSIYVHSPGVLYCIINKLAGGRIGGGAQSTVNHAFAYHSSPFMLAHVRTPVFKSPEQEKDAESEMECLRALKGCPYVLQFYFGYYYMRNLRKKRGMLVEYCNGGDLFAVIEKNTLTFEQKIKYAKQILRGVQEIHARGILHRDLKLENILIKDGDIVIADFGLSTFINRISNPDLVDVPTLKGTPEYLPPELLAYFKNPREKPVFSLKNDVYAVGICLYIIFHNSIPFPQLEHLTNPKEVEHRISMMKLVYSLFNPSNPIDFTIKEMLNPDLNTRPMIKDLKIPW
jgi:serine/threonine protein kinase